MPDVKQSLVEAMNFLNVTDPVIRNGIMAIAANEGGFGEMKPELGYSHTDNDSIRRIFGNRVSGLSDDELTQLKADDKTFFDYVYSAANETGRELGNQPGTDDGYNFRGRGPIQFTGRGNYTKYGALAGHPEVVDNPDALNDPEIGAAMTVAYILDRYHGGGFERLMASVGNNIPEIAARKQAAFESNMAGHVYDVGSTADHPAVAVAPAIPDGPALEAVQEQLTLAGYDPGTADGLMGPHTAQALRNYQTDKGLPVTGLPDGPTRSSLGLA